MIHKKEDGLFWPVSDSNKCYDWTYNELAAHTRIVEACERRRSIVHAGANVGVYALKYSEYYDTVYALEPENNNFKCLSLNCIDKDNIILMRAALGNLNTPIDVSNNEEDNCGTFALSGSGNIPQLTIDNLGLNDCDCIHLDCEGYEPLCLLGAVETIKRCSPLIVIEWMNHSNKYGWTQDMILAMLGTLGYNQMMCIGSDMMFKRG